MKPSVYSVSFLSFSMAQVTLILCVARYHIWTNPGASIFFGICMNIVPGLVPFSFQLFLFVKYFFIYFILLLLLLFFKDHFPFLFPFLQFQIKKKKGYFYEFQIKESQESTRDKLINWRN